MFLNLFFMLREAGIPVGIKEYLDLLATLNHNLAQFSTERFYALCRATMVKHEQYYDRFDLVFGYLIGKLQELPDDLWQQIPDEWLKKDFERLLTDEEKALIESLGGLEALMERFEELMAEQKERHAGGNKWIGTGGTSPFGAYGYNPEGFRIGQKENRNNRAVKVWDKRVYRNLDSDVELDTRTLKMALKKLRILTREGLADELDLDKTIDSTTRNAGMLEVEMMPPRKNNVKVLLLFDVGGSMDHHIESSERLFSAARHEFKHMEYFYFHNCLYESVWKDNRRRWNEKTPVFELFNTYNSDYKVIFIGDATMSPYEITHAGGSVEHYNDEPGTTWLSRFRTHFPDCVWLNPTHIRYWQHTDSISMLAQLFENRMFPLTLAGIGQAMKSLKNKKVILELSKL